jgi:hypothetical protein
MSPIHNVLRLASRLGCLLALGPPAFALAQPSGGPAGPVDQVHEIADGDELVY